MNFRVWILDRNGDKINCKSVNNALGFELTTYVINPKFIEEKLNEEMDTAQITLEDYPQPKCLEPKTKIIIERWDNNGNMLLPYFHMIVKNDNVESYVGLEGYYTHRLDLVEVSAIAQGYHVDNIALTYELQDVNLDYDLNIDLDKNSLQKPQGSNTGGTVPNSDPTSSPFWRTEIPESFCYVSGYGAMTSYTPSIFGNPKTVWNNKVNDEYGPIIGVRSYKFEVEGNYGDIKGNYLYDHEDMHLTINIPKIKCYKAKENNAHIDVKDSYNRYTSYTPANHTKKGYHHENASGTWEYLTECETVTTIIIKDATTGAEIRRETYVFSPQSNVDIWQEYYARIDASEVLRVTPLSGQSKSVEIPWDRCKDRIKLCNAGNATNSTYKLDLEANKTYEITTTLNTENNLAVIHSKTDLYTSHKPSNELTPICGTFFKECTNEWGSPQNTITFATTLDITAAKTPLLRTPQKYNLLNVLKKAILSAGTFHKKAGVPVLDTPSAFIVDEKFADKLFRTPINETVFYEKNLWEVFSSIGYYVHAIPYLEFENNEQFKISFRELGKNSLSPIKSKRITIFNSKDIEEYFGTFDSYVKNLYSPENIIDEYIPFKTKDGNYLISNETVCGLTSKNILQIRKFCIVAKNGVEKNALPFIFEKSIYDTLSMDYKKLPSTTNSIFYVLGTNEIQGMSFEGKSENEFVSKVPYAIKTIIGKIFNIIPYSIKVNDYYMHIEYNTADSARIKQTRPNLNEMILNSKYDRYPVHEQFYGQEAKIIDSERYGNLLYGELLKTGNGYFQTTEWNEVGAVKEVGDIELINEVPYYISLVESEWYDNLVLQKITYHKDFNAISKVISIPCEPRFYEVATTSVIERSPHWYENLIITTGESGAFPEQTGQTPRYISKNRFSEAIKGWLFGVNPIYPDYAVTTFKDDPDTQHGENDVSKMFVDTPKIEESGNQILTDKVEVQNKLLIYSSQNALLFEWGMEDNFSAGSFVNTKFNGVYNESDAQDTNGLVNRAYYGLWSLRYCDLYGRADLMDFALITNDVSTIESVQKLPQKVCSNAAISNASVTAKNCILNKDNRESLKNISFQINLITNQKIFFGRAVWRKKKNPVKVLLLDNEISKFSFQNLYADAQARVLAEVTPLIVDGETEAGCAYLEVKIQIPDNIINDVCCIAIVDGGDKDNAKGGMPYIYKNVKSLTAEQKRHSFYVAAAKGGMD